MPGGFWWAASFEKGGAFRDSPGFVMPGGKNEQKREGTWPTLLVFYQLHSARDACIINRSADKRIKACRAKAAAASGPFPIVRYRFEES